VIEYWYFKQAHFFGVGISWNEQLLLQIVYGGISMCNNGNSCWWIIILVLLFCCCGNGGMCGGNDRCDDRCGCC